MKRFVSLPFPTAAAAKKRVKENYIFKIRAGVEMDDVHIIQWDGEKEMCVQICEGKRRSLSSEQAIIGT